MVVATKEVVGGRGGIKEENSSFVNMGETDGKRTHKRGFATALSCISSLVKGRIGRVHRCIAGN
jgi:hypothetical protein